MPPLQHASETRPDLELVLSPTKPAAHVGDGTVSKARRQGQAGGRGGQANGAVAGGEEPVSAASLAAAGPGPGSGGGLLSRVLVGFSGQREARGGDGGGGTELAPLLIATHRARAPGQRDARRGGEDRDVGAPSPSRAELGGAVGAAPGGGGERAVGAKAKPGEEAVPSLGSTGAAPAAAHALSGSGLSGPQKSGMGTRGTYG